MPLFFIPAGKHFFARTLLLFFVACWTTLSLATPLALNQVNNQVNEAHNTSTVTNSNKDLINIKVLFNWNHQFEYAGFYAALQQGYYQQAGLSVSLHEWNKKSVVQQVANGDFQIGVDGNLVIADAIKNTPIKLLLSSLQRSPVVLLSNEPIESLREIQHKKIMLTQNFEIYALLNKAGLSIDDLDVVSNQANLQDFIQNNVDLYAAYQTNEPFQLDDQGHSYTTINPENYGISTYGDFTFTSTSFAQAHPEAVLAFKQATLKGWDYALKHPTEIAEYIFNSFPVRKTFNNLISEANKIQHYVKTDQAPIGHISLKRLVNFSHDLYSLGFISKEELTRFDPQKLLFSHTNFSLTDAEKAFLNAHPVIRLANDISWAPMEFIDDQGNYQGIAADYIREIEAMLNIRFEPNTQFEWDEVIQKMQTGELDMFSCSDANHERSKYADFTRPYLSIPLVILGNTKTKFIYDLNQLSDYRIAVVSGYYSESYLKERNPFVKMIPVDNLQEGIKAINNNQADLYIGNLAAINHTLMSGNFNHLKIVGSIDSNFSLAMGVRHELSPLVGILQKAIDAIPENKKNLIKNQWLNKRNENTVSYRQLALPLSLIFLFILLILLLLYAQNRYQKRLQQHLKTIDELSYSTITDANRNISWVSENFCKLSGYTQEELIGKCHERLKIKDGEIANFYALWEAAQQGKIWHGELHALNKDGNSYWVWATAIPMMNSQGKLKQVKITRQDITNRKKLEEMTNKDELTGLYNRRYFNQTISDWLQTWQTRPFTFALVMLDIDHFKNLNDHYGHLEGDKALKKVSNGLIKHVQEIRNAIVFRMGGEEFAILLPCKDCDKTLRTNLETLRLKILSLDIENKIEPEDLQTPDMFQKTDNDSQDRLSISIGAYCVPASCTTTAWLQDGEHYLYQKSDKALYQAKKSGRNCVVIEYRKSK